MKGFRTSSVALGPSIRAVNPWALGNPGPREMQQLLSREESAQLAEIASTVKFGKGAEISHEGDPADAIFNITSGVIKAHMRGPRGTEHVSAFLFAGDLFGLAQDGRYVSSITALTPVTAYRFPIRALANRLSANATLEFHFITKLCHELRQAQRHSFLLASNRTVTKLTIFLQMLQQLHSGGELTKEIYLPMSRSDIADYVGTSLAAISRAFRTLRTLGILRSPDRRHVEVLDNTAFEKLACEVNPTHSA